MEDFGDILFYLVVAIIAIVGAVANKRKNKTGQALPHPDHMEQEDDTIFAEPEEMEATTRYEMIDEGSFQPQITGPAGAASQSPGDRDFKMGKEAEGNYYEPMAKDFEWEGQSVTDTSITKSEVGTDGVLSSPEQDSWANELADEFDLPKAIVYSEILKRKDFV